ncbi:PIR protein [Plasmodium ovale]|uniref:PIR Superfamily Protein n=2 Tax=Plasmodium ovale TaxID=36330 RepID=A0A1A8WCF1_PLAOA|nr:PIR Superfamily Protein [Plasmodium ovale curtisi]SBT83848.1 PIR protein [Plasmodium ovale]
MSTPSDIFTFDQLKEVYEFLGNTKFGKIYEEFSGKNSIEIDGEKKCEAIKNGLLSNDIDHDIQLKLCDNLYKVIVKVNNLNNNIFSGIDNDDKMYCFCLKYWLYNNIDKTSMPMGVKIDGIFEKWQNAIKDVVDKRYKNPCVFRELELELEQHKKLNNIYEFILMYYENINSIREKANVDCKYVNYFGKGLKAYYESVLDCSKKQPADNYCKEFNEFKNTYVLEKIYWDTSKEYEKYNYDRNNSGNCALKIESHNEPLHLTYWYDKEKLHLSNQPIGFQKSTIISTSSALGATAGISAFLLYLFKFTNIRSLFGQGKQQDNTMFLNVDEGSHDFTFPISDSKYTNFGNNQYNISYLSVDNS